MFSASFGKVTTSLVSTRKNRVLSSGTNDDAPQLSE